MSGRSRSSQLYSAVRIGRRLRGAGTAGARALVPLIRGMRAFRGLARAGNLGRSVQSYLRGQRARRGVAVRSYRGGSHPILAGRRAAAFHVVHDRPAGSIQIIGTNAAGSPTMAHQWSTAPSVVRPAAGQGSPNVDVPFLGPLESIGRHVRGAFEDISHLFG